MSCVWRWERFGFRAGTIQLVALVFWFNVAGVSAADAPASSVIPPGVKPLELPGIHNVFQLTERIYSGSAPEGEAAFAALAKLGIKTIITVDGTKPDVATAQKFGLRYIHLPHGYDGISTNTELRLVKAAETAEGPIFVHCHHGKHRGATAAAIICMSEKGWSPQVAEDWLHLAGTASNYAGLYRTVREFKPPTAAELRAVSTDFPSVAKVSSLVDMMVDVDARWDALKAIKQAGYAAPKDHPDLAPANEATLLWEHFRELQRLPECNDRGAEFLANAQKAEAAAQNLQKILGRNKPAQPGETRAELDRVFESVNASCLSCHKSFRDTARAH